jgi:hypothetical protein
LAVEVVDVVDNRFDAGGSRNVCGVFNDIVNCSLAPAVKCGALTPDVVRTCLEGLGPKPVSVDRRPLLV